MKKDNQYQLIDSGFFEGDFMKLERVGEYILMRPSPSAVWEPSLSRKEWLQFDARFKRDSQGSGEWIIKNPKLQQKEKAFWWIQMPSFQLKMKLTSFGHLGVFPEQLQNWNRFQEIIKAQTKNKTDKNQTSENTFQVLNLFAYTGGSTLACAKAGASVTHVDASKGTVQWARENADRSDLARAPIRWLVDDVQDFVAKEVRREKKYHAIILDPPTYGRGPHKEIWDIEKHLLPLLKNLKTLLHDDFSFVQLSCHSPGFTPKVLENLLRQCFLGVESPDYKIESEEMTITGPLTLPSGCTSLLQAGVGII